jgi:hypothetical protein
MAGGQAERYTQTMDQLTTTGTSVAHFLANLSVDVFIFVGFLILACTLIARYGKRRSVSALVATLIALLLFRLVPTMPTGSPALDFIAFAALIIVLYTILKPMTQASFSERRFMKVLEVIILTASAFALALTAFYHIGSLSTLHDFNALIDMALTAPYAPFAGIALSVFGIAIVTRPKLFQ